MSIAGHPGHGVGPRPDWTPRPVYGELFTTAQTWIGFPAGLHSGSVVQIGRQPYSLMVHSREPVAFTLHSA